MSFHPIRLIIQACDRAISDRDFDSLMMHYADDAALVIKPGMVINGKENIRKAFIAISDHFQNQLVVKQGKMQVIEGAGDALVLMETLLSFPDGQGEIQNITRRATYVFRNESDGRWLCTIDNSYGTTLLEDESD
ncbi:YybH family protein [Budvicia aquatica]|uniref:DUF4440 domain-containing protein n=1 Tax=Budvicia aquatica TaxID=82979 RepID=A0A2C6CVF2_9GAMM|nr:SgcJ/EcaC family oxidoreductase [Budvicia aquatica]PHI30639.1 DUF4440 domain-containing protein [Budvicia aquatica]